jgi:hypothetical protein
LVEDCDWKESNKPEQRREVGRASLRYLEHTENDLREQRMNRWRQKEK